MRAPEGRAARLASALTLAALLVTWNTLFDRGIDAGVAAYLAWQQEHAERGGDFVSMQEVMRPAAAASAMGATAWSAPVALAGVAAVWGLDRRARRRRRAR